MTDRASLANVEYMQVNPGGAGVQIVQPAPPPPPPSQIFPPNLPLSALCVGRDDEIEQLKGWLIDQVGNVALIALQGIGGIGKTRLALEFIRRHQKDFPGGIFWLNAENETQREDQFYNILCLLESTPSIADLRANKRDIGAMLGQAVARYQPGQRRLWVLDNIPETPVNQRPVDLNPWRPVQDGQTSCLITSRRKVIESVIKTLEVQSLSREAAAELLTRHLKPCGAGDLRQAREIAAWVGYLPLALELISCTLQDARTLRDWHQCIHQEPSLEVDRIFDNLREYIPAGRQSVATVFFKSYQLLTTKAQTLARIFAHFGPDPIPTALKDSLGALASDLHRLQSCHFITGRADDFVGSMHRVLAAFLRSMEATKTENDRTCARKALIAAMPWDLCSDPRQRHLINPIRQHALAFLQRSTHLTMEDTNLSACVANAFQVQGEYNPAKIFAQKTLEVSRRTLGEEHPQTLTSMNNLASTLHAMGDLNGARGFEEKVLEVSRRTLGEEHPDTLTSMNNLASTLYSMGDLNGARGFQETVLEVRRRTLGEEHPDTLTSMNNLAVALYSMGDLNGARGFEEKVLEVRRRTLGEEHPQTLTSMSNLAHSLHLAGEREQALSLAREALAGFQKKLGIEHPNTKAVQALVNWITETPR